MSAPRPSRRSSSDPRRVPSPLRPPAPAAAQARTASEGGVHPAFVPVSRRTSVGAILVLVVGIVVAAAAVLLAIVYLLSFLGPALVVVATLMAFVPLALVLLVVHWIDRWEPEPRSLLLFAFLWGAGVAVVGALVVDLEVRTALASLGASGGGAALDVLQSIVQAPVVEEAGKGFGVLLIVWFGRRYVDGPVDGIAYAATVAAGFAFTENVQYFGIAIADATSLADVAHVFAVRGLMSPFAHAMFTSMTGLVLGLGARSASALGAFGLYLLGLVPAVALHALWNGALYVVSDFFGYYVLVQVPLFALLVVVVALLRRQEMRVTLVRLGEYAAAGWFVPAEIPALATPAGRRTALAWARAHGLGRVMRRYIRDATRLALVRQRIVAGRRRSSAERDEAALLEAILASRRVLRPGS